MREKNRLGNRSRIMRFTERALLKVYLESSDLARLVDRAGGTHAAEYARNLILEHLNGVSRPGKSEDETGDGKNLRDPGPPGMDPGRAGAPRPTGLAVPPARAARGQASELQLMVASRTGHQPGCPCFQCSNTRRFLESMREAEAPQEPPKKRGRTRK